MSFFVIRLPGRIADDYSKLRQNLQSFKVGFLDAEVEIFLKRLMDFRRLRFFVAGALEFHSARAVNALRVVQPHLNQEIRKLEGQLGSECCLIEISDLLRSRRPTRPSWSERAIFEATWKFSEAQPAN